MIGFIALAILVTLCAVALVVVPLFRNAESPAPVAAVIAALAIPAAALLLYATLTSYPWMAGAPGRGTPPSGPMASQGPMDGAPAANAPDFVALRQNADQHPDDINAWLALGEGYVEADRFADAKTSYGRALQLQADNSDAQLGLAEAQILEDRSSISGESGKMVESVLRRDPINPKALWYAGMVALSRGDNAAARFRWGQLLKLDPPAQVRHVIEQQLKMLDSGQPGGLAAPATAASANPAPAPPAGATAARPAAGASSGLSIRVSLDGALKSRLPAGAPLFVFARDPDRPGPPVAVVKRSASELPATIELTDANMMVPGQTLSSLRQVKLTARISGGGGPIAAPGDLYGEWLWTADQASRPIEIVINQIVGAP